MALTVVPAAATAQAQEPVVNAVLFYSPTCPHCHEVIDRQLPPLRERFGERFVIVGVDVTTPGGSSLYEAAVDYYGLAPDRLGVPLLVIGDVTLLGSREIPDRLPGLIEEGLAAGGTPWPTLPALREALAARGDNPAITTSPTLTSTTVASPTAMERFRQDPVGNGIAVAVLVLLVAALILGALALGSAGPPLPAVPAWLVATLGAVGFCIAVYLSMVEVTGAQAVCGPVGDCNAVQQSEYARLFGLAPVAILGALGYLGILTAWVVRTFGPERVRRQALLPFWTMAFIGTAFSAYLTFLEPFVIGATCAWCVSSALIMAALLLAAGREVQRAR
jgi:uncharacterized membrane protein